MRMRLLIGVALVATMAAFGAGCSVSSGGGAHAPATAEDVAETARVELHVTGMT